MLFARENISEIYYNNNLDTRCKKKVDLNFFFFFSKIMRAEIKLIYPFFTLFTDEKKTANQLFSSKFSVEKKHFTIHD